MDEIKNFSKTGFWKYLPFFIGLIYLSFCIAYTYERILNIDNSFYLFQIINKGNFNFSEKRYGNWLSQLPVLIFLKLGFSLKNLIYVYSISFPVLYLLIIWICSSILKNSAAALAAILCLITGVAFSFFHPVTETHQALALSCLLFAILTSPRFQIPAFGFYILSIVTEVWCLLTHPVAVYVVSFILTLVFFSNKEKRKLIILMFLLVMAMVVLRLTVFKEPYDARKYDELLKSESMAGNFLNLSPIHYLIRQYSTVYVAPIVLILISLLTSLWNKKYRELLICAGFSLFLFVSTVMTYNKGDTNGMMEKSFMPVIFMFVLLFAINFYEWNKGRDLLKIIVVICCYLSFTGIAHTSYPFNRRLNILENISQYQIENKIPKMIANYSDFNESVLKFNEWSTGIDVLMLSTCKLNRPVTLFLTRDKNTFEFDKTNHLLFLCLDWWPYWDQDDANPKYFKIEYATYKVYKN